MTAVLLPNGRQQYFTTAGLPAVGYKIATFDAGTSNPRITWQDALKVAQNTNPIILDGRGEASIFWEGAYKVQLQDSTGAVIWTQDNLQSQPNGFTSTLVPAVTNTSDLGSTAFEWRNLYLGTSGIPALGTAGLGFWLQTPAELALAVTPAAPFYAPGDVRRYGAVCNGVADDTAAINQAANVARQAYVNGGGPNYIEFKGPGPCLVSASLNFSTIDVFAYGEWKHIQATAAQFDVITSTGSMRLFNLRVDGAWDGVTAGQTGDILSLKNTPPAFPYENEISNCIFINAKRNGVYIERSGYTSFHRCQTITCGLHALQIKGTDLGANASTTVKTTGACQWGNTPNGYGIWVEYGANHTFIGDIVERTKGIWIGGDNRALAFIGVYQENTSGLKFLDWSTSSGLGILVAGCFGGNGSIAYNVNYQDQYYSGNSNLAEPAVPLANRIIQNDGGQLITAVTGGVDVTAAQVSLNPGTWMICASVQTVASTASGMTQAACQLTTNVADSGLNNSTTASFNMGADEATYNPGVAMDQRLNCFLLYQNKTAAAVTIYLRAKLTFSGAGNLAYHGFINAVKFQ